MRNMICHGGRCRRTPLGASVSAQIDRCVRICSKIRRYFIWRTQTPENGAACSLELVHDSGQTLQRPRQCEGLTVHLFPVRHHGPRACPQKKSFFPGSTRPAAIAVEKVKKKKKLEQIIGKRARRHEKSGIASLCKGAPRNGWCSGEDPGAIDLDARAKKPCLSACLQGGGTVQMPPPKKFTIKKAKRDLLTRWDASSRAHSMANTMGGWVMKQKDVVLVHCRHGVAPKRDVTLCSHR